MKFLDVGLLLPSAKLSGCESLGNYVEPDNITLSDFIQDWLKERKLNVAVSTYQNYISFNKCHINPRLGHFRIQKIEPLIVQRFIYDLVEETILVLIRLKKLLIC